MIKIVFLISILTVQSFITAQTNYYVSTSGSNSNDGSWANPWLEIQHGVDQLSPGDILNIREGVYHEKIDIDVSGTELAYITIRNYVDEDVVLDASNFTDASSIIWTDNSYLRIKGLHLTNHFINYANGLLVQGAAHHIEIIENKISNIKFSADPNANVNSNTNAVPLQILGDLAADSVHHIIIRGNKIFNNQTGYSENLTLGGNVSEFLIEENTIYDNTNIGIDATGNYVECPNPIYDNARNGTIKNNLVYNCNSDYSPAAGIYIDGGKNIIVENNICHNNGYGGEIGCEENGETKNIIFRNNIFFNNFYAGMHIGGYDETKSGIVIDSKVLNNTFYQNDVGLKDNGEFIFSELEDCIIENNIFYISPHNVFLFAYRTQTNLIFDYNLVYNLSGSNSIITYGNFETVGLQNYYNMSGYGIHSTYGNPYFINAPNDFHIPKISPAVNTGNPNYITDVNEVDVDGEQRTNGIIDCGTDEHYLTSLLLETKIFLEGAYNSTDNDMTLGLNNVIPLTSPYSEDARVVVSIPTEIADWVLVELRESVSGNAVVSKSVFLHKDGRVVADDGITGKIELSTSPGSYYVIIKHRNHLSVISKNPISLNN